MARRYVVAGAPCSGKSTFVRAHAEARDLIYDYDSVHMALSGRPSHDHDAQIRPFVLAARDGVYGELEVRTEQAAWVITSTRKTTDLEGLRDRLGAEVVVLMVDREEAHRRCALDGRPEAWHGYIDRWFDEGDIVADAWPVPALKAAGGARGMNRKEFRAPIALKTGEGEEGTFEAVFATFNVIDRDGDVIKPEAFTEGQRVRIAAWGHNWGVLPVGDGVLSADEETARVKGRFFTDTEGGRETYRTVKNLGPLQEWSFGFDILKSAEGEFEGERVRYLESLDVYEVSPVMLGAGIGTRTTGIKSSAADAEGASADADDDADGSEGEAGDGNPSGGEAELVRIGFDLDLMELAD